MLFQQQRFAGIPQNHGLHRGVQDPHLRFGGGSPLGLLDGMSRIRQGTTAHNQ
jgi:hypothetical protein